MIGSEDSPSAEHNRVAPTPRILRFELVGGRGGGAAAGAPPRT